MVEYRFLTKADLHPQLLRDFHRQQEVRNIRRKRDGVWTTESRPFVDDWDGEKKAAVIWIMGEILDRGGRILGAYVDGSLKGIIGLEGRPLGSLGQYREVCGFWVSQEFRGQGIGRKLFSLIKEEARVMGGEKLYISSHPAVETQAFYAAMGCREAEEYSPLHVQREPDDCQLECSL